MNTLDDRGRAERIEALNYDYAALPKQRNPRCNLCGGDRFVTITHRDRYGYPAQAEACPDCGCTALNPRLTAEGYQQFYESVYRPLVSAYHGRLISAKTIQGEQAEYAHQMVNWCEPVMPENATTMLDIGGSTGIVSAEFVRRFGLKATVIDPAPDETAEAEALGIESITGFIEDFDPRERQFDVVGMFQTIDHLMDVSLTLEKARQCLHPNGLFVFDIVDFMAAIWRNRSVEAAVKIDHVYSLTQAVTEAYLRKVGFRWVGKCFAPDALHVVYFCRICAPSDDFLPDQAEIRAYFEELRRISNGA